jgi:acyl-CoA synthetase (AMP-forming)/AMP-acid ligase II
MNIATVLEDQARRFAARPAIVERGGSITFAELDRAAASAAADLRRPASAPACARSCFSPMSIALYTTMIALFRLRVTAVFVDPSAGRERLDRSVRRVRPDAFVAVPRAHWLRLTSPAIRAIPIKAAIGGGVPLAAAVGQAISDDRAAVEPCEPDTPAIITFTSGSTGEPKAAVRTHGFLLAQHRALVESIALAAGEVDLCTLPIFLLANLASGVTSVIPDADLRAPGTHRRRTASRPDSRASAVAHSSLSGVSVADRRSRDARRQPSGDVSTHLHRRRAGVSKDARHHCRGRSRRRRRRRVWIDGGEPIAEIDRRDITPADRAAMSEGRGLLTGRPAASIDLRILADRWGTALGPWSRADLDRESLDAERVGEIAVVGDHVLPGYLDGHGDEETKIKVDGRTWHRTGDAGYFDATGRVWLMGRCAAKAIDAKGVLYPFAVECAASDVDGVGRTAFVMHRGQRVLAAEVSGDAAPVRQRLAERLAWARLDDIVGVPRVPVDRRHNAKVEYVALRELLDRARR